MRRTYHDPEAPEVLEAILDRIRAMTREELEEALSFRPDGVEETFRTEEFREGIAETLEEGHRNPRPEPATPSKGR